MIRASLRPHLVTGRDRFTFDGPDFRLRSKSALALSMALHELGTNALKYGALSVEPGRVALHWTTDDGRFRLRWQEDCGPAVASQSYFGAAAHDQVACLPNLKAR